MKRLLWIGLVVLVAVVIAVPAWIALDDGDSVRRAGALAQPTAAGDVGTLTLVGGPSGTLTIPVQSFDWQVVSPRDTASGAATGQAQRRPFSFLKAIDENSPVLFKMLTTNEAIQSAKLELQRTNGEGEPETYMTYDLGAGGLASWDDTNNEKVELAYTSITTSGKPSAATSENAVGQLTALGQTVPITDFATGVKSPRDAASGLATGKRQHKPFTISKPIDAMSASLLPKLLGNQTLGDVTVELQRPDAKGNLATYATYTYKKAFVSAIDHSGAAGSAPAENLELVFQSVEVKVGPSVASDTWASVAP